MTDIVDINGVKIEVDLSGAQKVEHYKVGDHVKVLVKSDYSSPAVYPAVVVGFEPFPSLPTIVLAYLKVEYSSAEIKFVFFNAESKNVEICRMLHADAELNKADAINRLQAEIDKKQAEVDELVRRKNYFVENFRRHFSEVSG